MGLEPSAQAALLLKFLKQSKIGAGLSDVETQDVVRKDLFVKPPKGDDAELAGLHGRLVKIAPEGSERSREVAPAIVVLVPSAERGKEVADALRKLNPIKARPTPTRGAACKPHCVYRSPDPPAQSHRGRHGRRSGTTLR